MLGSSGLPVKPVNINEYAVYTEQVPSGVAWWISQLERVDESVLRGNWPPSVTFPIYQTDTLTAYAFEFSVV
jgi:hypothetical protein